MFTLVDIPQLREDQFEATDSTETCFHGPSLSILGTPFHTFAFSVRMNDDGLHVADDPMCEEGYQALQGFYEGVYRTIKIRGKDCVLIVHPFTD